MDDRTNLVSEGRKLVGTGRFAEAYERFGRALKLTPGDAELHYLAGTSAWRALRTMEAGQHLAEAVRLVPGHPVARQALADWSLNTGKVAAALEHSAAAVAIAPGEPEVLASRAAALAESGEVTEAWGIVKRICETGYVPLRTVALRGILASQFGDEEGALEMICKVLGSTDPSVPDRTSLHFVAAQLLEKRGEYDRAIEHIGQAHVGRRRPYDPGWIRGQVDGAISYYTPGKLHRLPRSSHEGSRPVFIIGMPRSGTSLVEQILASHPDVYGAGELEFIPQIADAITRGDAARAAGYPGCMDSLSLRMCDELANRYLWQLSQLDAEARYVTDKLPLNFMHLGIITMLFPNSHVIHCTRDPMDTCLSCYMTDFSMGNAYAQDLGHVGAFYVQYQRLIGHWRDTLNVPMIEVSYEKLVGDLEGTTRELLEYLDLPWDTRCMAFHRNTRQVGTASSQQVRQPIYKGSIGRWRRYERHLGRLSEALGDVRVREGICVGAAG